eukprot:1137957-Pelagomonas_calceolata.AAC.4
MAFCKEYNAATQKMAGDVIPVEISVYECIEWGAFPQVCATGACTTQARLQSYLHWTLPD